MVFIDSQMDCSEMWQKNEEGEEEEKSEHLWRAQLYVKCTLHPVWYASVTHPLFCSRQSHKINVSHSFRSIVSHYE